MPSLLTTVPEFTNTALGMSLASYTSGLPVGALDRMLMESSDDACRHTDRLLAAPPATTVGTGGVAANAPSVPLSGACNIMPGDVLTFPDGQTVEVTGVDLATPLVPTDSAGTQYPGVAHLLTPLAGGYAAGTSVQAYRQERYEIRGKSTSAMDGQTPESQEGQLARMHAPLLGRGQSSRVVFLRQYPVWSLFAAYESLPWSNTETSVDLEAAYLLREQGWYRLPVGFYNPLATIWRTQFLAGFTSVPYDIKQAVHLLLASRLVVAQTPLGAVSWRQGDMSATNAGLRYEQQATALLCPYTRTWM